jgi:hypothetical protein
VTTIDSLETALASPPKERHIMSTKAHSTESDSHIAHTTSHATAPATAAPTAAIAATAKPSFNATVFVSPPPANANIPLPPKEYAPTTPGRFKNVVPRIAELSALPQALVDVRNFADYAQVFGEAAPSLAEVTEGVSLGSQWSTMRVTTQKWGRYCVLQEGLAWLTLRLLLARLGPVFTIAVQANPKLASRFPGLTALLGAKKSIAQKGASTKRLNKQAKAEGKPEIHGVVGKKRQRQAAKAALVATAGATNAVTDALATRCDDARDPPTHPSIGPSP